MTLPVPIKHGRIYLAPMVQGSELAFRMLVRKYNKNNNNKNSDVHMGGHNMLVCYSPMLRAKQVLEAHRYWNEREQDYDPLASSFKNLHEDAQLCLMDNRSDKEDAAHLVVQICGPCPVECKAATLALLDLHKATPLAGIDFNLGCPQECASKGRFGAFLAEQTPDLAVACVKAIRDAIEEHHYSCSNAIDDQRQESSSSFMHHRKRPRLSCKIRLQDTYATTLHLAKRLQDEAGCELLTVHCRRRTDKHNGPASIDDGTKLVQDLDIPVVINGAHIENMDDTERILKQTGAYGVMIARAFLEQPDLLSGGKCDISEQNSALLAADYLEYAARFPPPTPLFIRRHLRWIFRSTLQPAEEFTDMDYKTDWRPRLWTFLVRPYLETMDQFRAVVLMYIQLSNIDAAAACKSGEASRMALRIPLSLQGLPDPTFKSIRGARIRS